jgi:hypothetical protein
MVTACTCPAASKHASCSSVALCDGWPLRDTLGTCSRLSCVAMPPTPRMRQLRKSKRLQHTQPQKAVLTSIGPSRCAFSASTGVLMKRCFDADPLKPLASGTATLVKRVSSKKP